MNCIAVRRLMLIQNVVQDTLDLVSRCVNEADRVLGDVDFMHVNPRQ